MKSIFSIKLKSAALLMVIAINTVVAFACSVGLNMGYNNKHHHQEENVETPVAHSHQHSHNNGSNHHESASSSHHHEEKETPDDDCCTGNAVKFQTEDKKLQQSYNVAIKTPVFVALLSSFFGLQAAPVEALAATYKYIIPQYYPPPDIRVVIQSFQI